ncbi:hypothetical protein ACFPN7_26195 [Amycolatopsis halotolerans]
MTVPRELDWESSSGLRRACSLYSCSSLSEGQREAAVALFEAGRGR